MHAGVIEAFVESANTAFGKQVLKVFFAMSDQDGNGTIEEEELKVALHSLGFDWLKEKQVKGIFKRADTDENGRISLDEWLQDAPRTLRTNLIKLAKKNGSEMGLLA